MFQLGSRLVQFQLTADPSEYRTQDDNSQQLSNNFNGLLEKIRYKSLLVYGTMLVNVYELNLVYLNLMKGIFFFSLLKEMLVR